MLTQNTNSWHSTPEQRTYKKQWWAQRHKYKHNIAPNIYTLTQFLWISNKVHPTQVLQQNAVDKNYHLE